MKALFLSVPLHGHVNPTLPLVRELVDRHEEIVYFSTDRFAAEIERAGARYRTYDNPFLTDMCGLPDRLEELSWLMTRTTKELLDAHAASFRAEGADYVITDAVAPWGQWVADLLGVPTVTSVSTMAFNRAVLTFGVKHGVRPKSARALWTKIRFLTKSVRLIRQLGRTYGIRPPSAVRLMFGRSDLNIVYTSRGFQPCAETFDDRFQFVGPSIAPRTEPAGFPWEWLRPGRVVYVSLGTIFNEDVRFFRDCFEAFREEDVQVVMSVGSSIPAAALGPAPSNVLVRDRVPQLDVLRRASAFVTHGGMNSVSESLLYGIPVVVVPQMSEQEFVGRRVEELGAGLYVAKAAATAARIRESVRQLLTESRFREQAAVIRDSFLAAGGARRAADAIVDFTRKSARSDG
jgi:MGT family glycosyltransferase